MIVILSIPNPPSLNDYLKPGSRGVRFLSKKTKIFYNLVEKSVIEKEYNNLKMSGSLYYRAIYCSNSFRRKDIDNFSTKAVLDSMTKSGVLSDDSMIDFISYKRGPVFGTDLVPSKIYFSIYDSNLELENNYIDKLLEDEIKKDFLFYNLSLLDYRNATNKEKKENKKNLKI